MLLETLLSIGLMSGTSMDGIDAALLKTDGLRSVCEIGYASITYPKEAKILFKAAEYAIRTSDGNMQRARDMYAQATEEYLQRELHVSAAQCSDALKEAICYLYGKDQQNHALVLDDVIQHSTKLHAVVVKKLLQQTGYAASAIDVVGYHGQTMYHQPGRKISVIVGNGQWLADEVGIPVVNDFRQCDVQAGGQGAPFAPLYHQALALRDGYVPVAVVNCGGIANITLIKNDDAADLIAFDTGPGNGLIDRLVRRRTEGKECMDAQGCYGQQGTVHVDVLAALYQNSLLKNGANYLEMIPPKSLDIGDMVLIPVLDDLSLPDACATLEAFTAQTIVQSLDLLHLDNALFPKTWVLAGGGWKNPVILSELKKHLVTRIGCEVTVMTADEVGWNSQALEAQIFAYLAVRSLKGLPLSVPGTTRVPKPLTGGHAYVPQSGTMTDRARRLLEANPAVLRGYVN